MNDCPRAKPLRNPRCYRACAPYGAHTIDDRNEMRKIYVLFWVSLNNIKLRFPETYWDQLSLFGDKHYDISEFVFKNAIATFLPYSWDALRFALQYFAGQIDIVEAGQRTKRR